MPSAHNLLQTGIEVNARNKHKQTPLHNLCHCIGRKPHQSGSSCLLDLLEARADVTLIDQSKLSCMDTMCRSFYEIRSPPHGLLCDPALEAALAPLWLFHARGLRSAPLQEKIQWFRKVLAILYDHTKDRES